MLSSPHLSHKLKGFEGDDWMMMDKTSFPHHVLQQRFKQATESKLLTTIDLEHVCEEVLTFFYHRPL